MTDSQFNFRCPTDLATRLRTQAKAEGYGGRGSRAFHEFIERMFDFYLEHAEDAADAGQTAAELEEVAEDAVAAGVADSELLGRLEELLNRFDNPTKEDPLIRALARVSAIVFRNMKRKGEL